MTDKYQNKYRIPTNRLQGYDYGANGCYFVTICTKNRIHYFGEIVNKTNVKTDNYPSIETGNVETDNYPSLRATEIGKIAEKFWLEIPNHFPFVDLDQYVIMPNHIHGILIFNKSVESWQPNKFGRQSQNLGSVIRGFKSSLKRYANENNIDFAWQERFHDRIIRDIKGLDNVRTYIFNNPANWNDDELYEKYDG
jgi:REP element-mobilizing transposase RayT